MKLLFHENLLFRLVAALADVYPGSAQAEKHADELEEHVRELRRLANELR